MNTSLQRRLAQIIPRITQAGFLAREGIGNEIACHIFDYPAESELQVREYITALRNELSVAHANLDCCHIDLLDVMTGYLESRKLLTRALEMQQKKDDQAVIRALAGPMAAEKISAYITETHNPASHQLVLMSGVGSAWPVIRLHSLLNCMHKTLDGTPVVIFYPGEFDGNTLHLFNRKDTSESGSGFGSAASSVPGSASAATRATATTVGSQPYYRAFTLIPR